MPFCISLCKPLCNKAFLSMWFALCNCHSRKQWASHIDALGVALEFFKNWLRLIQTLYEKWSRQSFANKSTWNETRPVITPPQNSMRIPKGKTTLFESSKHNVTLKQLISIIYWLKRLVKYDVLVIDLSAARLVNIRTSSKQKFKILPDKMSPITFSRACFLGHCWQIMLIVEIRFTNRCIYQ